MRIVVVAAVVAMAGCGGSSLATDGGDAAQDLALADTGSGADTSGVSCGDMGCTGGSVCVRTQTSGGACQQPTDAGCPPGYIVASPCCVAMPSYSCRTPPPTCGATLTCACASSTFCNAGQTCTMPSAREIDCTLLAP